MAKKKKIAANPARGFATTSVASKSKDEKSEDDSKNDSNTSRTDNKPTLDAAQNSFNHNNADAGVIDEPSFARGNDEQNFTNLTPEQVERKLEEAEVQQIVDKYSQRSSREANRYVSRSIEERRILRKQTQTNRLYLRGLLGGQIIDKILNLATAELTNSTTVGKRGSTIRNKAPQHGQEEELIYNLWVLKRALRLLHFKESDVENALEYATNHLVAWDQSTGSIWGLEECIEWLVLNMDSEDLPSFNQVSQKPEEVSDSGSESTFFSQKPIQDKISSPTKLPDDPSLSTPQSAAGHSSREFDSSTDSDLESDIEPDNLIDTYLNLKSRLYAVHPELVETKTKISRSDKQSSVRNLPKSTKARRLFNNLVRIESDPLFDKAAAEVKWIIRRNQIAQETASKSKTASEHPVAQIFASQDEIQDRPVRSETPVTSLDEESQGVKSSSGPNSDDDEGFSALFQSTPRQDERLEVSNDSIVIKNFGGQQGLAPRRVLEDAIRSRDSKARLQYTLISRAAFSCRHLLKIQWSRSVGVSFPIAMEGILSHTTSNSAIFEMQTVATPDSRQSEAYVSVVALFQIFSRSTQDGKVYLRLPPVWRDLWSEFETQHRNEENIADQEDVHTLRNLVERVQNVHESQTVEASGMPILTTNNSESVTTTDSNARPTENSKALEGTELKAKWLSMNEKRSFQHMLLFRKTLPIFDFKDFAMSTIEENQVTIICGETGCGKSTQIPSFLLEQSLMNNKPCKIYCTEPRRISAITLAQRVNQELGGAKDELGTNRSLVGYAIRLETKASSSTRLMYATTGILLRMLESNRDLEELTHIVIDEVHERSIETDFLLIILHALIKRRKDLKLILMSATLNAERFSTYFGGAPILDVPGRTFPVQSKFLEDVVEFTKYVTEEADDRGADEDLTDDIDLGEKAAITQDTIDGYSAQTKQTLAKIDPYRIDYNLIVKLLNKLYSDTEYQTYAKAVLIFLPGIGEIRTLSDMLQGAQLPAKFIVHALHSAIPSEDQQKAFDPPPPGYQKIVVSTNIAETGVTIPDVTCVIDAGKHREMRFDEKRQVSRLIESFISRANAKQRRGRAGRVQPGICFHLFTKARHDKSLPEEQTPEMLRLSLQDLVMRVKIYKMGDAQAALALALDPPSAKNVRRAIETLTEVGALTTTEELTALGRHLSKLPLDPYLGKLVLNGIPFKCLDTSLSIAAMLTSKSIFFTPFNGRQQTFAARSGFAKGNSDLLTDFNAYASWRRTCINRPDTEFSYCRKNLLSVQALTTVEDLKAQLLLNLSETGLILLESSERSEISRISNSGNRKRRFVSVPKKYSLNEGNWDVSATVIATSFYPKFLARDGKGWRNVATNQPISIHPTSILRSPAISMSAKTQFLSFYSILQTSTGARHYNATSLSQAPILALALFVGEPSFNPIAQIISLDGSRLRFSIEADTSGKVWKEFVALKALRRYLQEALFRKIHSRYSAKIENAEGDDPWLQIWQSIVERLSANLDGS